MQDLLFNAYIFTSYTFSLVLYSLYIQDLYYAFFNMLNISVYARLILCLRLYMFIYACVFC